jgi:hypothetical protein
VYSLASKPEQIPRFVIFLVSAVFVGALSAAQRGAMESLRRAHDKLNETVQELKKTNEALAKSKAYLAHARTLLGPRACCADDYLFGRREIVIPPRLPEP